MLHILGPAFRHNLIVLLYYVFYCTIFIFIFIELCDTQASAFSLIDFLSTTVMHRFIMGTGVCKVPFVSHYLCDNIYAYPIV